MGFENFNSSEVPAAERTAEVLEVNKENIIEGRGFDEISRVGWEKYREALTETPYADIVEKYLTEKEKQPADTAQGGPPQWMQHNMNVEARTRATKLANFLTENYGKQKEGSTFVAYGGEQNDNKLMIRGKRIDLGERGTPTEMPVRRIYFSVPTAQAPEAFKALFDSLVDNGAMSEVDLALNLESYQGESLEKSFENNTIIVYAYGNKPEVMEQIAKSVQRAKEQAPEAFRLIPKDTAAAKENNISNFMIPLDDTAAFVEAENLGSYHAGPWGRMYADLTGEMPNRGVGLKQLAEKLKQWTPQRPGLFSDDKARRRYMPGLIFGKTQS